MSLTNLLNFFFPRTVEGAMASFQKTIDDLHKVADHHVAKYEKHEGKIETLLGKLDDLQDKLTAHTDEANKALALSSKLQESFGLNQ